MFESAVECFKFDLVSNLRLKTDHLVHEIEQHDKYLTAKDEAIVQYVFG